MKRGLLIAVLRRLLPPARREWPDAMLAELEAIPDSVLRHRFAAGCVRALLRDLVAVRLRNCAAYPQTLALALVAGLGIAMLDQASDTRYPMWIALGATSALFAWWRPVAAWRWGLLLATGMPLLAAVSDTRGPYAFDQGDAMYGTVPAIVVAMIAAFCRCRVRLLTVSLFAVSLAAGTRIANAQSPAIPRELTAADLSAFADSAFADYLRGSPRPSLAFVVVKDGATIFARGYGAEDAAGTRSVDPDTTLFWLASLSKLLTTDAVMREVERGRIDLAVPVTRYLPWQLPSPKPWRSITVEDLLTHTHGLDEPFMQGNVDDVERLVPLCDYLAQVRWRAGTRPGDILRYSNHGMALAGCILERTSGIPFAEYVEREIFSPLGMTRSTFRQPVPPELAGHIATAGTDQVRDYLLPTPAGAMVGTATDMGRFLIAQLDAGGPRAVSLRAMHATHWRGHPAVPGVALGWFETSLGSVRGLYHTGARHHFSVAWLDPPQRVGLFLVHSMRQEGPFQDLRTKLVRGFVERYVVAESPASKIAASRGIVGVYRPELLSTTTVERAGYLFLDTPIRSTSDGNITMHAPGGVGTMIAHPIGDGAFEVRTGAQTDLRIGFIERAGMSPRIAMGGTLLDPVLLTRLAWWQRGSVHAVLLGSSCFLLVLAAAVNAARWIMGHRRLGRRRRLLISNPAWLVISASGLALGLAVLAFAALIISTPETGAAEHMRSGLRSVLVLLSAAAVLCGALPLATLAATRHESIAGRVTLCLLSSAGVVAAVLLWHYRLVGFQL